MICVVQLGNLSPASGRCDPGGRVDPCYSQAVGTSVFSSRFTSFHTYSSVLTFFCFFVLFLSCCSCARVLGQHSHMSSTFPAAIYTEWYLLFSGGEIVFALAHHNLIKLNLATQQRFKVVRTTLQCCRAVYCTWALLTSQIC